MKTTKNRLPQFVIDNLKNTKTMRNEIVELEVYFKSEVQFPSINAASFIVDFNEFIDSHPSPFEENLDESNKLYRFFYSINIGHRSEFEDMVYNKFFSDESIKSLEVIFIPEEFYAETGSQIISIKNDSNKYIKVNTKLFDKADRILDSLNICVSKFKDLNTMARTECLQTKFSGFQTRFNEAAKMLSELTSSLQHNHIDMQLVPLETITGNLKRMVRDYCRKNNKKIKLAIKTNKLQFDKKIIEKLHDPFIHLIRNSMDHGIEAPEDRLKQGKNEEGTITITGFKKAGRAVIEIHDDGKGIDTEMLKAFCLHKGIYTLEQLNTMNKEDMLKQLFTPGFSTAKAVTDISGRGIGLDVVKNVIKGFNGSIKINTQSKKGTKFTLVLPESLSLVKSIFFACGDEIIALPAKSIKKIINTEKIKTKQKNKRKYILFNNSWIPAYEMKKLFRDSTQETKN
ncbi:hypothetical protein J7L67_04235, partial [bacterium]|nr:hypothetical protein [bacterium]